MSEKSAHIYMKSYHESLNEHAGGITTEYGAEGEVTDYIAKNWDISSAGLASIVWTGERGWGKIQAVQGQSRLIKVFLKKRG